MHVASVVVVGILSNLHRTYILDFVNLQLCTSASQSNLAEESQVLHGDRSSVEAIF